MYTTVQAEGRAETSVKHSKFLAFSARVSDEEEAESFLRTIKKRFSDATHAPYAYILGERGDKMRASDDGEPSGTSGAPILETIKGAGLTFVCCVVVRYFGGIKLGTGGLAHAYGDAATASIQAAGKAIFEKCAVFSVACDYNLLSAVQNKIYASSGILLNAEYEDGAKISAAIPIDRKAGFLSAIADATSGRATVEEREERYCEID